MTPSSKYKVILTDYEWPDLEIEHQVFDQANIEFIATHCSTEEQVLDVAEEADALISEYAPITSKVIEHLPSLKVISMNAAGYDNVDLGAASEAGVLVVNCPDYCYEEVADHTMALLLALVRGVVFFDRQIKEKLWDFKSAGELSRIRGKILGLIGFGGVARAVACRAQAFGMKVIAADPYLSGDIFQKADVLRVSRESLLCEADYVSIHTPRTNETVNLISKAQLETMKPSAFLVNTSRGSIVDEEALLQALKLRQLKGAALDVLSKEPPDMDNPLLACENVVVTPHAAFYSEQAMEEVRTRAARAVVQVLQREWPQSVVNRKKLEGKTLRAWLP